MAAYAAHATPEGGVSLYALTIDVDWAPDEVVKDTLALIDAADLPATFFATHQLGINLGKHEVALHPNVLKMLGEGTSLRDGIAKLQSLYPNASGVRGHCLCSSTRFYPAYHELGLTYESGYLCYGQHGLNPFWMIEDIVQLPIFWEDDLHFALSAQYKHRRFSLENLHLEQAGLKTFVFHPIHIWLNTTDSSHYERAKPYYQDVRTLMDHRNTTIRGTRDFFIELLEWLQSHRETTLTLDEIQRRWRASQEVS